MIILTVGRKDMNYNIQFPQADNLEFIYQVYVELPEEGLDRYSFSEKYKISDRQGAYYLNAICFIGLAEKKSKKTTLTKNGEIIQMLDEPFRKKVFLLSILENQFVCNTYHIYKATKKEEQKKVIEILIEGTYGITNKAIKERRARTLLSWYKWFEQQDFYIEEKYNE